MPNLAQWSKLNEYLLQVGAQDDAIAFGVNALERLRNVVPYDQGRAYFFDESTHVFDEYLVNVSKKTTKAYHEYYAEMGDRRYSATKRAGFEAKRYNVEDDCEQLARGMRYQLAKISVVDWSEEPHDTRFFREYVATLGLTFSTGFLLHDHDDRPRLLFCIDRTRPMPFSRDEVQMLFIIATHLDNMYRKIFSKPPVSSGNTIALMAGGAPLTERERQIATMLMRGSSSKAISDTLHIARTTVYKHIQNIHAKLGVSNQVELLAKLSEAAVRGRAGNPST